tara:strand:+ start:602 stop:1072 length:471 start_codon:yes stop_codon:yes gene_type:complete
MKNVNPTSVSVPTKIATRSDAALKPVDANTTRMAIPAAKPLSQTAKRLPGNAKTQTPAILEVVNSRWAKHVMLMQIVAQAIVSVWQTTAAWLPEKGSAKQQIAVLVAILMRAPMLVSPWVQATTILKNALTVNTRPVTARPQRQVRAGSTPAKMGA